MGANFTSRKFYGYTNHAVEAFYKTELADMIEEQGNDSYSGHWGVVNGFQFKNISFDNSNDAYDYISDNNDKWNDGVWAVRVKEPKSIPADERLSKLTIELQSIRDEKNAFFGECLENRRNTRKTATCNKCKSHTKIGLVKKSSKCPNCNASYFYLSQTENKRLPIFAKREKNKLNEIAARKRVLAKIDNKKNVLIKELYDAWSNVDTIKKDIQKTIKNSKFISCSSCGSKYNTSYKYVLDNNNYNCLCCSSKLGISDSKNSKLFKLEQKIASLESEVAQLDNSYWILGSVCSY